MRTRNNNSVTRSVTRSAGSYSTVHTACNGTITNGGENYPALTSYPSAARLEHMKDYLGKGSSHPVHHRVFVYDINDGISTETWGAQVAGNYGVITYAKPNSWFDNSNVYVYSDHSWDVTNVGSIPPFWTLELPDNENVIKNDVLKAAAGLKADVLLNIVEANQLWPSVRSLASCLPQMAMHWGELRKMIKTASGAFLAWKFGVSPILQDTMSILRSLPRLKQDIQRHKDGDKTRTMKMVPLKLTFGAEHFYSSPYYANGQLSSQFTHQGRVLSMPNVRYVLVTEPQVRYHTSLFSAIDASMRRFATSPAQLAWELVPFSFVLDWFVDLRGVAREADKMLGFSPYRIKSFTRSVSYHCATDCFTSFHSPCNGSVLQTFKSVSLEYKHYDRSVIGDSTVATVDPRFGKNQAAITAALIAQKLSQLSGAKR